MYEHFKSLLKYYQFQIWFQYVDEDFSARWDTFSIPSTHAMASFQPPTHGTDVDKKKVKYFFLNSKGFAFSFMVHILSSSIFTRTRLSYFFLVNHSFNSFKLCAHWKSWFDCSPYLGQHQGVMQLKLKWCILGWPWNLSHGRWLVVGAKQTQIRIPDGCKLHCAPKLSGIRQGE